MQTEILAQNPLAVLRVYAIWFNMYPGDDRSKWDDTLIADPRVTRLWDERKTVGHWLVDHEVVDYAGEILWDAYLLFGPEAIWDETPAPLVSWGQPVYRTEHQLQTALSPLLGELPKKARHSSNSKV